MLLRTGAVGKRMKLDIDPPPDDVPSLADMAKFSRARAGVTVGFGEASATNLAGSVGKNNITWSDLPEKIVKTVAGTVALAFGRPNIMTFEFVFEGLLMIDPPIAHEQSQGRVIGGSVSNDIPFSRTGLDALTWRCKKRLIIKAFGF